jgi:hypothetical protein
MGDSYNTNGVHGGSPWPLKSPNSVPIVEDLNDSWADNVDFAKYPSQNGGGSGNYIGTPTLNLSSNGNTTRRYHENSNGTHRILFDEEEGGKLGVKEDNGDEIDPNMIKEEVYDVLEAIDYHQGVMWGDNGQKVINAAAKAREDERLRMQQNGKKKKDHPITDDLRTILVAAKARGINLRKWFAHFDERRTGRISSDSMQKALSGLGLGLSIGGSNIQGGVDYSSNTYPGKDVPEDVVERVINPIAMSKLIARLNDGKGSGIEGCTVPYGVLISCGNGEVQSNQFDRLMQSGGSLPTNKRRKKKARPVTPYQAQAQAKARVRARIRSDAQKVKKKSTKKSPGSIKKAFVPPRGPQTKVVPPSRKKRGKQNVTETGAILVPGESGLNVQVAIQTMQRITNKSIAKREAKEKARLLKLMSDETTFEDRLVKLIQAPGPFHEILKQLEQKQKAGRTVTRKYVTITTFENVIRKLFHLRISQEDCVLILRRATEITSEPLNATAANGDGKEFFNSMSPREKHLVEEHGPGIVLSTKRMLKYLRRLRCRKRMDYANWFDKKQIKIETSERANKELLLNGANGDIGALKRVLSSANELECDALVVLSTFGIKKSAPKITGHIVRDAISNADLVVAMTAVQAQLLLEGSVKDEAAIMAGEWVESNDGRTKILSLAREEAGIGPRFSAPVTPPSKRSKSKTTQEELYPDPPSSVIKSASEKLKLEKIEELLKDENFHTTIYRILFGEYSRNMVKGGATYTNFEDFQKSRSVRHKTLKSEINNWQRKKAKVEMKKKSADTRFADVNEVILFVQDLILNSAREFSNMTMKYNKLKELGARRQLANNSNKKNNKSPLHSSFEQPKDIYSNTSLVSTSKSNALAKIGTISKKEFLDVMNSVFFSLQADPKTALVAGVVLEGINETVDKSYKALIATESGVIKLKELGEENMKRMQDKFVKENRLVQDYVKLFAPDSSDEDKALSVALMNLNKKEAEAEEKFNEWLKKKKHAQNALVQREKKLQKKKEKKKQKTLAARSNKIKEFKKRIKSRKKKMSKAKSKPLSARPTWSKAWKGTKEEEEGDEEAED